QRVPSHVPRAARPSSCSPAASFSARSTPMTSSGTGGSGGAAFQPPAVRPPKVELAIGESLDPEAVLVHRTVMTAAQQREVGQRRRATLCPVADVMTLRERQSAAGEATTSIAVLQRAA